MGSVGCQCVYLSQLIPWFAEQLDGRSLFFFLIIPLEYSLYLILLKTDEPDTNLIYTDNTIMASSFLPLVKKSLIIC